MILNRASATQFKHSFDPLGQFDAGIKRFFLKNCFLNFDIFLVNDGNIFIKLL